MNLKGMVFIFIKRIKGNHAYDQEGINSFLRGNPAYTVNFYFSEFF